jgi:hypothetical protein
MLGAKLGQRSALGRARPALGRPAAGVRAAPARRPVSIRAVSEAVAKPDAIKVTAKNDADDDLTVGCRG